MAYESSKSSTKNQAAKAGTSAKSSAKLAATSGDTKSGMPTKSGSEMAFQECDAIEADLAALKVTYDFYFMGHERLPPTRAYEDLKKRLERLKNSFVRNTAAKFRVQAIATKFGTYERLWQRTLQEIENGTYKRDVAKAKRRTQKPAADKSRNTGAFEIPDEGFEVEEVKPSGVPSVAPVAPPVAPPVEPVPFRGGVPVVAPLVPSVAPLVPKVAPLIPPVAPVAGTPARGTGLPSIPSVAPRVAPVVPPIAPAVPPVAPAVPRVAPAVPPVAARPPAAKPAAARPPVAASGGGIPDDKMKSLYDAYVAARRQNKEDTSKMSYDSVAATLRKKVPELMKQHGGKSVEFKVVIQDGKTVLKPVIK